MSDTTEWPPLVPPHIWTEGLFYYGRSPYGAITLTALQQLVPAEESYLRTLADTYLRCAESLATVQQSLARSSKHPDSPLHRKTLESVIACTRLVQIAKEALHTGGRALHASVAFPPVEPPTPRPGDQ